VIDEARATESAAARRRELVREFLTLSAIRLTETECRPAPCRDLPSETLRSP